MNVVKAILDRLMDLSELEKQDELGGGSFGIVSKVYCHPPLLQDPNDRGVYALKRVSEKVLNEPRIRLSFFREVFTQILASHPAVVPIYAWNVLIRTNLSLSFVMPCYENGTLRNWMGKLNPTQQLIVAYGIARGMRLLHSKFQIIHRDLKPANIFLDSDLRPLVADLGMAKVMDDIGMSGVTGSRLWQSPELLQCQENGSTDYGLKVDVYAYGMIVYELIEGRAPELRKEDCPNPNNFARFLQAVVTGKRPPLNKASAAQREFIQTLLEGEPKLRPSFSKICAELERNVELFQAADRGAFQRYKAHLDNGEVEAFRAFCQVADDTTILPSWSSDVAAEIPVSRKLAFDILTAAIDGDREAQKCAAVIHLTGVAVAQSYLQAARFGLASDDALLRLLAKVVPNDNYVQMGEVYEANERFTEASQCYRKAAEAGSVRALWRWGTILIYNDVGLHFNEGVTLLKAANAEGLADAAFELARLYIDGVFVSHDEAEGVKYAERAAALGHPDAAFYLGRYYHARFDVERALKWYREADAFEPVMVVTDEGNEMVGNLEVHGIINDLRKLGVD